MKVISFTGPEAYGRRFMDSLAWIYAGDKNFTPRDARSAWRTLFENPALDPDNHVKVICGGEKDLARALLYKAAEDTGYIGFVEFAEDYAAFGAMMDFAKAWFAERGVKKIWGPIDLDTWHSYRFMTKGFEQGTFAFEPYNKQYYPAFFERCGFKVMAKYFSQQLKDTGAMLRYFEKLAEGAGGRYGVRRFDPKRFEQELELLYGLSAEIFSENFAYGRVNKDEFMNLYGKLKPIMGADTVVFGMGPDGREAGFIFGYPEIKQVLGSKNAAVRALMLMGLKSGLARPEVFNVKTIGVLKEYRRTRLAAVMSAEMYRSIIAGGYKTVNHCLIKEGNTSGRFDAGLSVKNKEYCLYEYKI